MAQERRQLVKYNFYRVDPKWRGLAEAERERGKAQLLAVAEEFAQSLGLRSYSTVGLRADTDLLLWLLALEVESLQEFAAHVNRTAMGPYLTMPYSYLALTRKSPYLGDHRHEGQEGTRTEIIPPSKPYPYLIVYPFVKTNEWYQLPNEERQRMMRQHFAIGHKYPTVRINTSYSFGLDDPEHMVVFETSSLADFQECVMEMREAEARKYTLRDTPIFTCVQKPLREILNSLG